MMLLHEVRGMLLNIPCGLPDDPKNLSYPTRFA